jgi:PleD family two-component response regulator
VEACITAERFRNAIEAAPWQKRAVTASFGVTTKSTASINAAALINAADSALYQSKVSGRNLVTQTPYKLSQPCENR